MTVSRPRVLRVGDEVRIQGQLHTVDDLAGGRVRLLDVIGTAREMPLAQLLADPSVEPVAVTVTAPLPPAGLLENLPDEVIDQARWWERHIVEVLTGLPPGAAPGTAVKAEFDPARHTLRKRELAKIAELEGQGRTLSLKTLQRLRQGYEREGLWALVDRRFARRSSPNRPCR